MIKNIKIEKPRQGFLDMIWLEPGMRIEKKGITFLIF